MVLTHGDRSVSRRLLGAVLAMALIAGLVVLGWTWRHPAAFRDAGGWGIDDTDNQVGDTLYVGMTYPRQDGGHVTLHGGQVNFRTGEDNADADLLLCTIDPDAPVGAIGGYRGDTIHEDCSELVPLAGQRLALQSAGMSHQVVLKVTLTRPGSVEIADITLDYSHGWQRGSQRTGGQVTMTTGDAGS